MKIKFYNSLTPSGRMKCTIHRNGKLGFSKEAIKKLNISEDKYIKLGINEEDINDKDLYALIQDYSDNETYKINKAGEYFYVNTKTLFDKLNINYVEKKVIFDIYEVDNDDNVKLYKLSKREITRKKQKR